MTSRLGSQGNSWSAGCFTPGHMVLDLFETYLISATCISCKSIFEHANNTRCSPFHELLLQGLRVKSGRSIKNLSLIEKVQIFKTSKGMMFHGPNAWLQTIGASQIMSMNPRLATVKTRQYIHVTLIFSHRGLLKPCT